MNAKPAVKRVRRTIIVLVLVIIATGLLVVLKWWITNRYLLGH